MPGQPNVWKWKRFKSACAEPLAFLSCVIFTVTHPTSDSVLVFYLMAAGKLLPHPCLKAFGEVSGVEAIALMKSIRPGSGLNRYI